MIKYTLDEKITHITAWRSSGLTAMQYVTLHDIKYGSFKNWPSQIKKAQATVTEQVIIPVKVSSDTDQATGMAVTDSTADTSAQSSQDAVGTDNNKIAGVNQLHKHTSSMFTLNTSKSSPCSVTPTFKAGCPTLQDSLPHHPNTGTHPDMINNTELSVLLPSGLIVKCQLVQLADVVTMMEVRYDA